ncbi:conserved exported hypothetical protein [Methylocella tundrae]|uniref:Uncharacterized protein n=1 Tax=Methylocella tundrae TaxID=227605 RepID=A0A8B6MBB8_METTU|nr:hypothetical protein [Methylocella tundrae]VTZ27857.1 conserved exported hypothetical protein [Methylocella tundrae]VTZ51358.1 conserved exported hypothetical protein [Methylocella tundrae]
MRYVLAAALMIGALSHANADCACGPDYCLGDPRFPQKLAAKKARLAKDYPARLVALLDRAGACVAAVDLAPDGFSLMTVAKDGSKLVIAWDIDSERISRAQVADGRALAFYMFNAAHRLACCGETPYDRRPDWDANLGVNTDNAIACKKAGGDVRCQ